MFQAIPKASQTWQFELMSSRKRRHRRLREIAMDCQGAKRKRKAALGHLGRDMPLQLGFPRCHSRGNAEVEPMAQSAMEKM